MLRQNFLLIAGQRTYTLKLKPDKRNTGSAAVKIPDSLDVVMPFRYAEIKNADQEIQAFTDVQSESPVPLF